MRIRTVAVFIVILGTLVLNESLLMATTKNSLKTYHKKRAFAETPEPSGKSKKQKTGNNTGVFVVQKHNASHLHYDFRIEVNGVLKSWAVPKGISTNPTEKHLAIQTEDHPLEYATFEGKIPEGNYGAGTVKIWDTGTFENIKTIPMDTCLKNGHVELLLKGKKLKGAYALIKTNYAGRKGQWLIFKMHDNPTTLKLRRTQNDPVADPKPPRRKLSQRADPESQEKQFVKIGKRQIELTNPDKILFSKSKITKKELVEYYENIAAIMLPYMKNRAVTMHRFPNGITEEGFYQKDIGDYFPDWIKSVLIKKAGGKNRYLVCNDAATLVYLANQACITPHLWLSKIDNLNYPDRMIFDLDPGSKTNFATIKQAACGLRDILESLGLSSCVMTTGSRGLHVIVLLNRKADYDEVRAFARDVAKILVAQDPKKFTLEARLNKRQGRLFIDTTRNAFAQTTVAPYAVRAKPGAPVATPLSWKELDDKNLRSNSYTIKNIFEHLAKHPDPWKGAGKKAYGLKPARKKLDKLL